VSRSHSTKSRTTVLRHIQAGKRFETRQRRAGIGIVRKAAHVAVHAPGVGPVGFDRDGGEAFSRIRRRVMAQRSR
jgi:hypothetical protein